MASLGAMAEPRCQPAAALLSMAWMVMAAVLCDHSADGYTQFSIFIQLTKI